MNDWLALFEEVDAGMRQWLREHLRATLTETEPALDARWARAAGAVRVAGETAAVARRLAGCGADGAPEGRPAGLFLSGEGAVVALVHGQRREVRSLAVGGAGRGRATPNTRSSARAALEA